MEKAPTGTIVLREGTFYLDEPLLLEADNSGLTILAYPGENPIVSGGKVVDVSWEVYNVTDPSEEWEVYERENILSGQHVDDVHIHKGIGLSVCNYTRAFVPLCTHQVFFNLNSSDRHY